MYRYGTNILWEIYACNMIYLMNFEPAADNHSSGELPQTKENNNNIHDQNSESAGYILEQKIQGETQTETESLLEVEQKLETGIVTENVKEEVESKTYGNDKIQEQLVRTVRSPKISKSVSAADKIVDEVTTTNSEFVNLIEATDLTEAKESEILDDYGEPKKDLNSFITAQESEEGTDTRESKTSLGENHHLVPGEAEKDPKSEIFKQEDNIDNISITLIGTLVYEETGLKETKPEIKEKLRDPNAAPQEQDETIFVTETRSDTVDTNERQQKNFNSDANREQIPKTADEGGEEKDHSIEEKTHTPEVDHVKEVSTSSIPPSEDNLQNISVPPPRDTVINKMSYLIEETPAKYESTYENAEPASVKSKHELLKELRTTGTEESANEEIQKQENEKLHMAPCLNTEQCTSDTEISKTKEVSDLADQNEACILETEKDEKPSSEALKHVKAITCIDDEKAIQEQEDPAKNFKDSLTCTMVENEATELDAGGLSEKHKPANSKTTELLRRKNHELDHPYEKLEFPAVAHDQIDDQHPQSKEDGNNIQEQNPETLEHVLGHIFQGELNEKIEVCVGD
ncbi:titin-like [Quillaja saponaria]|uniref:Titin-like n=1 Tax=Quillaja saponaria TaxID=32244 RepID=A0AAD7Q4B6_QUISA|nr:titin-like [Quillaja saponaria]